MTERLVAPHLQLLAVAVLIALLAWVLQLIRTQRLSLRDSLIWVLSTTVALAAAVFPEGLRWFATALGVRVPLNALFAFAFGYVLANLLSTTIAVSNCATRVRRLTQECAMLRAEVESLQAQLRGEERRPLHQHDGGSRGEDP